MKMLIFYMFVGKRNKKRVKITILGDVRNFGAIANMAINYVL